jgi:hypothetical protein
MEDYTVNELIARMSAPEWLAEMRSRFANATRSSDVFSRDTTGYNPDFSQIRDVPVCGNMNVVYAPTEAEIEGERAAPVCAEGMLSLVDRQRVARGEAVAVIAVGGQAYEPLREGGFFPPVTSENQEAAIRAIFADTPDQGQWLLDYIAARPELAREFITDEQIGPHLRGIYEELGLSAQQRAFLDATLLLDAASFTADGRAFNGYDISIYRADGTVTQGEMYDMMANWLPARYMEQMGDLLVPFVQYNGGLMQGRADAETVNGSGAVSSRHLLEELDTMPGLHRGIVNTRLAFVGVPDKSDYSRLFRGLDEEAWSQAITQVSLFGLDAIDSFCSAIEGYRFIPPQQPEGERGR